MMNNVANNNTSTVCSQRINGKFTSRRNLVIAPENRCELNNNQSGEYEHLRTTFNQAFSKNAKVIPVCHFSFSAFDSWFHRVLVAKKEFSLMSTTTVGGISQNRYRARFAPRGVQRSICVTSKTNGSKELQTYNIVEQLHELFEIKYQMEAPVDEQTVTEEGSNTIIETHDGQEQGETIMPDMEILKDLSNTETDFTFTKATDRYQVLDVFTITTQTTRNSLKKVYKFPKDLLSSKDAQCSTNTMPFQNFAYADSDIEVIIMCNGARFATGSLVAASFPDPYDGFDDLSCRAECLFQRPDKVLISLSKNNQGKILIENNYRRTFYRAFATPAASKGVSTQQFASLQIEVLSPLNVVAGQTAACSITVMYRFVKCNFSGMSYGVDIKPQAPSLESQLLTLGTTLVPAAKPIENLLRRTGIVSNQDKPYSGRIINTVPQPRTNFSAGVGLSDSIPMRLDHASTVTILKEHTKPQDPKTMLDIAKIEGIERYFRWSASNKANTNLLSWPIVPTACNVENAKIDTTPCPLKFVASCYALWRGTIELTFHIISNDFHTGTLQVETSFNRQSADLCGISSTYTKTFELGEEKKFTYTVPYIYDTVWRRTNRQLDDSLFDSHQNDGADDPRAYYRHLAKTVMTGYPTAIAERTKAYVNVTVLNPLIPIQSAPNSVEIIMTMKAGKDFNLHSLMPNQFHTAYTDGANIDDRPWFGRFPSLGFLAEDQRQDDPIFYFTKTSRAEIKAVPTDYNAYGARKDEGVGIITKGTLNNQTVYYQGPFTPGIAFKTFHTTDVQHRIKDILRRPIKIYSGKTMAWDSEVTVDGVKGKCTQSFWIPCHMPNHFDGLPPMRRTQNSVHASIISLFRHWRGSMRFTIFFHSDTAVPIYVTYVPNTGVRYFGAQRQMYQILEIGGSTVPDDKGFCREPMMLCETSPATEPVICKINPSFSCETSFDANLNRCVVSKRVRSTKNVKTLLGREEISDIAGHLIIQTTQANIPFDLFWSIGDDMELSSFIGTPHYNQPVVNTLSDDFQSSTSTLGIASVRGFSTTHVITGISTPASSTLTSPQDFHNNDSSTTAKNQNQQQQKNVKPIIIRHQMDKVSAALAATTLGVGVVAGRATVGEAYKISKSSQMFLDKAGVAMEKISGIAETTGTAVSELINSLQSAFNTARKSLGDLFDAKSNFPILADFFLDLFLLVKDFSPLNMAIHVAKLFCKILPVSMEVVMSKIDDFKKLFTRFFSSNSIEQQSGLGTDAHVSLLGTIIFLLGTACGVKYDPKTKFVDTKTAFITRMSSPTGLNYLPSALNFAKFLFETIKSASNWLLNRDIELTYKTLLADRSEEINQFCNDVDLLLHPLNGRLIQNSDMRTKLWTTVIKANQLSGMLTKLAQTQGTQHLMRYVERIRKFAEEKSILATCCPVRREPFVYCIQGPSNIGKSFLSASLALELLKEVEAPIEGNPIYTRCPGLKHFDGYTGQPVITYDDWLALSTPEIVTEQLSELFMLKSTSDCYLPMANITDKGMKANPFFVCLLTNDAFPADLIGSTAHTPEAVYRRRDVLINARKKNEYSTTPVRDIPDDVLNNFGHLEFQFSDPENCELINEANPWFDYEVFLKKMKSAAKVCTDAENANIQKRLKMLREYSTSTSLLDDPTGVLEFATFKIQQEEELAQAVNREDYLSAKLEKVLEILNLQREKKAKEAEKIIKVEELKPNTSLESIVEEEIIEEQAYRPNLIGRFLTSFPSISNLFESGCLPQVHDLTTKSEEICGEWVSDKCAHCEQSKRIYFGPSEHLVCFSCRSANVECGHCSGPGSLEKFSLKTLEYFKRLVSIGQEGFSKIRNYFASFSEQQKIIMLYALIGMFSTCVMAYAEEKMNDRVLINKKQLDEILYRVHTQADFSFNEKAFEKMMLIIVPRATKGCLHASFLEDFPVMEYVHPENRDFNYPNVVKTSYGGWLNEEEIIVPISPCGDDCCLLEDKNKEIYKKNCLEFFSAGKENFEKEIKFLINRVTTTRVFENCTIYLPPFVIPDWVLTSFDGRTFVSKKRSWLTRAQEVWRNSIPTWARELFKYLAIGGCVVGALLGAFKLVNFFNKPKEQIMSSGSYQIRHFLKKARQIRKTTFKDQSKTTPQNDSVFHDALQAKIHTNCMNFEIYKDDCRHQSLNFTGIANRFAIMPKHYLRLIQDCALEPSISFKIRSARFDTVIDYKFSESDFQEGEEDICIFSCPKTIHNFSNLIKYMATEDDLRSPMTNKGYIFQGKTMHSNFVMATSLTINGIVSNIDVTGDNGTETSYDSLSYNFSKSGACGSLVLRLNHTRPILAMHFAGSNEYAPNPSGYGVLLCQETFADVFDPKKILEEEEVELKPAEEAHSVLPGFVQVQSLGSTDKMVHIPSKTKIEPSLIQTFLPSPETLPGYLSAREEGYPHKETPLVAGCSKHGILGNNFSTEEVEEVSDVLWNAKYANLKPLLVNPKKLSLKEAITGLPDFPAYAPLHLNTSMGYDWVFNAKTQKKDYIKIERDENNNISAVFVDAVLETRLSEVENLRKNNIIPFIPYVDELKDERRALAKREKLGSTRVFCMASVLSSIPVRQNFLHFAAAYTNGRISHLNHAVGISTDGPEWGQLAKHLLSLSNNIVTLDYSNFGPGYNAMVNAAGHDIIQNWTLKNVEGVNENELTVLGEEHYNSKHIMGNLIYRQLCGGPSGDSLTVVKNGLVNELYMLLAWKHLMADFCISNNYPLYDTFFKMTRLVVYGDDLIMSVADEIKDLYNGVTIKHFFAKYGITATDALKTGQDIPYTKIRDASFLKCAFVPHPKIKGEWLAPLEERSIYETAKWVHKNPNADEATLQVAEASLRNSYGQGPDFFNSWKHDLNEALSLANLPRLTLTWHEIDANFFASHYNKY